MKKFTLIALSPFILWGCTAVDLQAEQKYQSALNSGQTVYQENCSACHGTDLLGTTQGPPLLWDLYITSHHPNKRMKQSLREGVSQHHWVFGDMPDQSHLSDTELSDVVFFVRQNLYKSGFH